MAEDVQTDAALYNLEGGQRHLVVQGGTVKAVAPGLRLVEATEEERQRVEGKAPAQGPREYGLPV
ncbi:MAG: hypothetical protein ACNA8S_02610 [Deferrisomatales bacterium]